MLVFDRSLNHYCLAWLGESGITQILEITSELTTPTNGKHTKEKLAI